MARKRIRAHKKPTTALPARKKKIKEAKRLKLYLRPETKKSIWGIFCFTLSLIFILSFFDLAGRAGRYFLSGSQIFFGKGDFLIPLILIILGIIFLRSWKRNIYFSNLIGGTLFLLAFLGILEVLGRDKNWGGRIGYWLGYPFNLWLGDLASFVIFLAVLVVSILILFNISLKKKTPEVQRPIYQIAHISVKKPGKVKNLVKKILKKSKKEEPEEIISVSEKIPEEKEVVVSKSKPQHQNFGSGGKFKPFPLNLLEKDKDQPSSGDIKANTNIIKRTLQNFGIEVEMAEVNIGPTVTQYTLKPAEGIKVSQITTLQSDLALALACHPLRIEAPIPGRSFVGIEVPNRGRISVRLRNLLDNPNFKSDPSNLIFALGRDVAGNPVFANLKRMPHLLIAGSTGTGKTICLNSLINSLLYKNSPESLRFVLIDPKRVEFPVYNEIPHLLCPVIVETQKAVNSLKWLINEMERRFKLLSENRVRDMEGYNNIFRDEPLPYLVLVIDELADLMASRGKEIEAGIVRLAQMSRAVGIHLVLATQRPSVEVITGLIKANITSRVAFQVASQIDSRTIIDMAGAEKLLGNGDMLFISSETTKPKRIQGAYVCEKEVKKVTHYLRNQKGEKKELEEISEEIEFKKPTLPSLELDEIEGGAFEDELYEEAKGIIVRAKKASASLLQRHLRIGYARAARILDRMEEEELVGPADGAKPREVYIKENKEDQFDSQ